MARKLYHCARCGSERLLPMWRRPLHVDGWLCPACTAVFRTVFARPGSTLRLMSIVTVTATGTAVTVAALHAPVIAIVVGAWAASVAAAVAVGMRSRRRFLAAERAALPAATL